MQGNLRGKAELTWYCSHAGLAFQMKTEFLNVVSISHAGPRRVCPPSMLFFPHLPWLLWLMHEELWSWREPTEGSAPIGWGRDWKERTSWWGWLPTASQGSSAGQKAQGDMEGMQRWQRSWERQLWDLLCHTGNVLACGSHLHHVPFLSPAQGFSKRVRWSSCVEKTNYILSGPYGDSLWTLAR